MNWPKNHSWSTTVLDTLSNNAHDFKKKEGKVKEIVNSKGDIKKKKGNKQSGFLTMRRWKWCVQTSIIKYSIVKNG